MIAQGGILRIQQDLKDRRLRRVVVAVNGRRVIHNRLFSVADGQLKLQDAFNAQRGGRDVQRRPVFFSGDVRVEGVFERGGAQLRVEVVELEFQGDFARSLLHAQHRRRDCEADLGGRQRSVARSGFTRPQIPMPEAVPFGVVLRQFAAETVRRIRKRRVTHDAVAGAVHKQRPQRIDFGSVDDRFARRRVKQFRAGLVFAGGKKVLGRNAGRRRLLLEFQQHVRLVRNGRFLFQSKRVLVIESKVPACEAVDDFLRPFVKLQKRQEQRPMRRLARVRRFQQRFHFGFLGRKEWGPIARWFGPIVRRNGKVLSIIVDKFRKVLGEQEQVFGFALIHVGKMDSQLFGHPSVLALPELQNHVLNDVIFSHNIFPRPPTRIGARSAGKGKGSNQGLRRLASWERARSTEVSHSANQLAPLNANTRSLDDRNQLLPVRTVAPTSLPSAM